jgi:plasmid maintenance system antidote protein VapI
MTRSAIHPGVHLAEAIEAIGGTAAQLARDIGVPPNRVTGILHGTAASRQTPLCGWGAISAPARRSG